VGAREARAERRRPLARRCRVTARSARASATRSSRGGAAAAAPPRSGLSPTRRATGSVRTRAEHAIRKRVFGRQPCPSGQSPISVAASGQLSVRPPPWAAGGRRHRRHRVGGGRVEQPGEASFRGAHLSPRKTDGRRRCRARRHVLRPARCCPDVPGRSGTLAPRASRTPIPALGPPYPPHRDASHGLPRSYGRERARRALVRQRREQ
jgi:hypothetical protein